MSKATMQLDLSLLSLLNSVKEVEKELNELKAESDKKDQMIDELRNRVLELLSADINKQ